MHTLTRIAIAAAVIAGLTGGSAEGANRWWDGGTTNIVANGDGASQGGAGTWNTTTNNWDQGVGLAHVAWVSANNDIAIFGGVAGGTVTLSGTPVVGGLQFDTAGYTLNNGTVTFGTSGNIVANVDVTMSFANLGASGTGVAITKTGTGKLTHSSNAGNGFLGQLTVAQGTLSISRFDSLGATAATKVILGSSGQTGTLQWTTTATSNSKGFTMAAGGTGAFDVTNATTVLTLSGAIDGATGNLTKTGAGTLLLTGTNTYSGTTTVNAGALQLSSTNALPGGIGSSGGTSALTLAGGVVGLGNGNFTRALGTGVDQVQFTGSGGFAAYTADRTVNLGGASAGVAWNSGSFVPTGSALILGAATADKTVDFQNPLDLNGATRTIQADDGPALIDGKISGAITGTGGGLVKTGAGVLALSGANTYDGGTAVNAGTLTLLNTQAQPASGTITVAASTTLGLGVGGGGYFGSTDVDNLFANTMANVSMNATADVGIDTTAGDFTYGSSVPSSTKGLTKLGANTLTLSGSNAFTGPTAVSGGTLALANTSAIGTSSRLTLANGTTLALRSDTAATFTTPTNAVGVSTVPDGATVTIDVNNNGSGSGNTLTMSGGVRVVSATSSTTTLNVTGGNGYTLNVPTLTWQNNGTQNLSLNPTTASLTIGTLSFAYTGGSGQTLSLDGTSTGNVLSSINTSTWLVVAKQGTGTWTWNVNTQTTALGNIGTGLSAGTLIVNGSLYFQGNRYFTMSGGTLCLNSTNAIGNSTAAQTALIITGGNLDNASGAPITLTSNPVMSWNGNFALLGSNGANSDLNIGTGAVTMSATRTVTINSNATLTVGGAISGSGFGLTKVGTGTLKLGGNNTYTGPTSVSTGTLAVVTGGSCSNSAVTVQSNATLAVSVTSSNLQWTCTNLTFAAGAGSVVRFAFCVTSGTTLAPLNILNTLLFNGTPTVMVESSDLRNGAYPLLVVNGSAPTTVPPLAGVKGSLSWGGAGNKTLYLNVAASGTLLMVR